MVISHTCFDETKIEDGQVVPLRMTDWRDGQSIIRNWPLSDEGQAKNDVAGQIVDWRPGKPETAVRRNMSGNILDDEDGSNRACLVAEAHERGC